MCDIKLYIYDNKHSTKIVLILSAVNVLLSIRGGDNNFPRERLKSTVRDPMQI